MVVDSRVVIRLGHSPDPDDVFMWWPLFEMSGSSPRVASKRFRFVPVTADIETLNRRSMNADLEITAMSCAHYAHVSDRYVLTSCGASMNDESGPKLVSTHRLELNDLKEQSLIVAVPGERTSAFAALSLMLGPQSFQYEVFPFDQVIDAVVNGEADAGLLIHEAQLTYEQAGLHLVADIARWWSQRHGLPLPLGVNAIRRDLDETYGEGALSDVNALLKHSLEYALAHREESIRVALPYGRGISAELAGRFIDMYVNRWTLELGPVGHEAVRRFLTVLSQAGLVPYCAVIDFVDPVKALAQTD